MVVVAAGLWALPGVPAADAGTEPPGPPGHVFELLQSGAVEILWSPPPGSPTEAVTSYDVAPVLGGAPCPTCRGANVAVAAAGSLVLGSTGGTAVPYAVRAVGPGGASAWVDAELPSDANTPGRARDAAVTGGAPWVAQPVAGQYTSPLDTAPPGWTRTVVRDGGFSAPTASDGDLWVFGDTSVIDTPDSGTVASGTVDCLTLDGTAAVSSPSLPPHLQDALQQVGPAIADGTAKCSGDVGALPAAAEEPYQLLGDYPEGSGVVCSNWVNGLANQLTTGDQLSNGVVASYGSNCFNENDDLIGPAGMWTTDRQLTSPGSQVITMPLGAFSSPDLPVTRCPADALTTYDGGGAMSGNYQSVLEFGGYLYFYEAYGNSTYAYSALGVPESTCSAMAIARVPAGESTGGTAYASVPADYQYLLADGQWASPAATGLSPSALAAESADVMPADYDGAYAGQVDVTQLASGELAMVYMLPAPLLDPGGGLDVAAVRTSSTPWGPWSAPAYFEAPGFSWGSDYQIVLHPELSSTASLALSYVTATNDGSLTIRQVRFMTLSTSSLPVPGTEPAVGYRLDAADGGIFDFGDASYLGSMGGRHLNAPVVGMASTPDGGGYWEVAADGGIFAFGDAPFHGSMGGRVLNARVVGMASTPDGGGYWEVAADGGVFAFGDAPFYGSLGGKPLFAPIVGMAADPQGGYWEVASDGSVFGFGAAPLYGTAAGGHLNAPIVGLAPAPDGGGYWEVAADGGVFAFGAPFLGSMGGTPLDAPIVGMAADPQGGYWLVAADGGVFAFVAPFLGSMGGRPLNAPGVDIAEG